MNIHMGLSIIPSCYWKRSTKDWQINLC